MVGQSGAKFKVNRIFSKISGSNCSIYQEINLEIVLNCYVVESMQF